MPWQIKPTTGEEEGPFEEGEVVARIHQGALTGALVRESGAADWQPMASHPAFAEALVAPALAAAIPTAVPVSEAVAPASQAPPPIDVRPPATSRPSRAPSKRVVGLAVFAAILLAVVAAIVLFARSSGRSLAAYVPAAVDVLVEVPNVRTALSELKRATFLDAARVDDKQLADDTAKAIAVAFDLDSDDAKNLVRAFDASAIAMRHVARPAESIVLLRFGSVAPVEKLLASKRFTADGNVGQSGRRYAVAPADARQAASWIERLSSGLSTTGGHDTPAIALAWFDKPHLLAVGSAALLTEIAELVDGGGSPLEKSAAYQEAKAAFGAGVVSVFVDPVAFRPPTESTDSRKLFEGLFKKGTPLTATATVNEAGMVLRARGTLTGNLLPDANLFAVPKALKLAKKLPRRTVAYVALATKFGMNAREASNELLGIFRDVLGRSFDKELPRLEKLTGASLEKIVGMLGEQSVVAIVTADDKPLLNVRIGDYAENSAGVALLEISDEAAAQALIGQAKTILSDMKSDFRVTSDDTGLMGEPQGTKHQFVRVKLLPDHVLFVGVGASDVVERSLEAYREGKDTLGEDHGYLRAVRSLPEDVHAQLWVDVARVVDLPGDAPFKTKGDDRIMAAMTLRLRPKPAVLEVEIDSLNALAPMLTPIVNLVRTTHGPPPNRR